MSDSVDHYLVLDVSPTASTSELYLAFCNAVRQWLQRDPTFNPDTLKCLQDSYRLLQDPVRRAAFHTQCYGKHLPYGNRGKERQTNKGNYSKKTKKVPKWKNLQLNVEPRRYETLHKDTQRYEILHEDASPQHYENQQQETSHQCHEYLQETKMPDYGYIQNQDPAQYFQHHQANQPQYYGYFQENQHQCYEYIQQESQPQCYGYLNENQVQYYEYVQENQPHYVY